MAVHTTAGPGGSGAPATPTTMQKNLTVSDHTQQLFRRKIVVGSGQKIVIGTDAVLVAV